MIITKKQLIALNDLTGKVLSLTNVHDLEIEMNLEQNPRQNRIIFKVAIGDKKTQ